MNCQIIKIYDKYLDLDIISSKLDNVYPISSIVRITSNDYLDSEQTKSKNNEDFFGKIVEIGNKNIKLELLRPQLFYVSKIIKIVPIRSKINFNPDILNSRITVGEKIETSENASYEFIPTVQVGESVIQGQKIGYLNLKTTENKFWILTPFSGSVGKINLGDYKSGNTIAIVDKKNITLGNENELGLPGDLLLKINNSQEKINLIPNNENNPQFIIKGARNLIIDPQKLFLKNFNIDTGNLDKTIFIFVTCNETFTVDNQYTHIILWDKHGFGDTINQSVSDLTLNIAQSGVDTIIITDSNHILDCVGMYKTINGEEVSITSIYYTHNPEQSSKYFANSFTLELLDV